MESDDQMNVCSFLIHYTKLSARLPHALEALNRVSLDPEIVSCWDGDNINSVCKRHRIDKKEWHEHTILIAPILFKNAGLHMSDQLMAEIESIESAVKYLPAWMLPRPLDQGEISVILKHYYALSRIAQGKFEYGIIAEDDILAGQNSERLYREVVGKFVSNNGDYLDLAGGCGLSPKDHGVECCLTRIWPPSTRTNACYMVSRQLAKILVENFFPFVHPIDWHLLYLLNKHEIKRCYWSTKEVFIHGSETGAYRSWRMK
jgi:GR25 family glycosyltransferase involved in LPS biosynthesis